MSPPWTTLVTTAELAAHLDDPDCIVIDCRYVLSDRDKGRAAYDSGHLPGARHAHLEADLCGTPEANSGRHPLPEPARLAERFGAWGITARSRIVACDDSFGSIAARLWWLARWLGHERVALLDGGLAKWKREHRPLTSAPTAVVATQFLARRNDALVAQAAEVARAIREPAALLLDARPEERFLGLSEPFDRIAGHIPTSINRPWEDNLAMSGEFQTAEQLRAEYAELLGGRSAGEVIHLCGSGVTACHSVLAMEIAGLAGSRLFPGSWSEGICDPAHPIVEPA